MQYHCNNRRCAAPPTTRKWQGSCFKPITTGLCSTEVLCNGIDAVVVGGVAKRSPVDSKSECVGSQDGMALIRAYPESFATRGSSKIGFHTTFGMPNILGCIDCTHVKIPTPPIHRHSEEYIKLYHSINVQSISDSDCKVMDLDVSWPGSVHDSRISKNSNVYNQLRRGELQGILLGDYG